MTVIRALMNIRKRGVRPQTRPTSPSVETPESLAIGGGGSNAHLLLFSVLPAVAAVYDRRTGETRSEGRRSQTAATVCSHPAKHVPPLRGLRGEGDS